mgnify:CR=1 FL=1
MKRRTVLQAGLAFGVIGTRLDALGLTAQETPPRVIVLQDIDADTNLDGLRSVMAGLVARQVPFACVIDPSVISDTALMPDNPIAQLVRDFYFAHPYASWERGTNENMNGLIRQYFPKNRDFRTVTDEEIQIAMDRLNNRPRKCLGYQTPNEVFFGKPLVALAG